MSDAETKQRFKDGDIFSWRYTEAAEEGRRKFSGNPYHCKSQIAVAHSGHLWDTFWSSKGDESPLVLSDVVLKFLGNPSDMKMIPHYERVFYRDEDVVSMRHSNNSGAPVYAKAPCDAETMKAYLTYELEKMERSI